MVYNKAAVQMLVSAGPSVKCRVLARHAAPRVKGQEVLQNALQQA